MDALSWRFLLLLSAGIVAAFAAFSGGAWLIGRFFTDYHEDVTRWEPRGVSDDGRTMTIEYTTSRCSYDPFDRVEREETASTVTLTVIIRTGGGGGCEDIAIHHTREVELERPLGSRRLVDGRTGSTPNFHTPTSGVVRIQQVVDLSRGSYVDGFQSYVRIERQPDLGRLFEHQLPDGDGAGTLRLVSRLTFRLRPEDYRLVSFQRPCKGTCDSLDLSTDRCTGLVHPSPLEAVRVTVTVRPTEGCRIEVG